MATATGRSVISAPGESHRFNNRLLAALPPADIETYFADLQPISFRKGELIQKADTRFDYLYFIEKGLCSILTLMKDGSTVEFGIIGTEGVVGLPALLGAETSVQEYMAQAPTGALRIGVSQCRAAYNASNDVRQICNRFAYIFINNGGQTSACNRLHPIEQRLCRWLLMVSNRLKTDVLPLTQEFLSDMLGVRRQGVTAVAGELQRLGFIRYRSGRIEIIDKEALEARSCECDRIIQEHIERLL